MADTGFSLSTKKLPLRQIPADSYLLHATNCLATWGAGIAAELASLFPAACEVYKDLCNKAKESPTDPRPSRSLAGKCLIIPPQQSDIAGGAPRVSIICLFTSYGYGRAIPAKGKPGKDTAAAILRQTKAALADLRHQLDQPRTAQKDKQDSVVIYSPQFNSGAFKVPWKKSEALIREHFADWKGKWVVLEPLHSYGASR